MMPLAKETAKNPITPSSRGTMMIVKGSRCAGEKRDERNAEQCSHRRAENRKAFAEHKNHQTDCDHKNWKHG